MAGSGVTLYALTSAGNKAVIGTIDWREDIYMPSQINDNVGQIMADIRAMANAVATGWIEIGDGDGTYTATYVSATSFRFDGVNVTTYYRAGMRVRVVAPTPGTLSGTITSSTFSTHTTLVVAWDSGSLSNEAITSVSLGVGSGGGSGAAASYRNILGRNGGFEVWQRGAGGGAVIAGTIGASVYTADGWALYTSASAANVLQNIGITTGSRWSAVVYRPTSASPGSIILFEYPLDTDEIASARGSVVTLSFTLRAGSGFTPASATVSVSLRAGTGTPTKAVVGYTGEIRIIDSTIAATTTATRYTFTSAAVMPSNIAQASACFQWTTVGTAPANDHLEIDDVQLEIGSVATPFERRPFEAELAACQRHFWKTFAYSTLPNNNPSGQAGMWIFPQTVGAGGAQQAPSLYFPTRMRASPTAVVYTPVAGAAPGTVRNFSISNDCSGAAFVTYENSFTLTTTTNVGSAVGNVLGVHGTFDAGI